MNKTEHLSKRIKRNRKFLDGGPFKGKIYYCILTTVKASCDNPRFEVVTKSINPDIAETRCLDKIRVLVEKDPDGPFKKWSFEYFYQFAGVFREDL